VTSRPLAIAVLLTAWSLSAATAQHSSHSANSAHSLRISTGSGAMVLDETPETFEAPERPETSQAFKTFQASDTSAPPFRSHSDAAGEIERSDSSLPLTTVFSSLAIVLGLFGTLVWVLKRSGGASMAGVSKETLQVLGRTALAPRQNIVLVRCGQRVLVLAVGGAQTTTLAEITDPDEVNELLAGCLGQSSRQQFHQTLHSLGQEKLSSNHFVAPQSSGKPNSLFASA